MYSRTRGIRPIPADSRVILGHLYALYTKNPVEDK